MKKTYFQPEITVAQFASMTLMQAVSPANTFNMYDIEGEQW